MLKTKLTFLREAKNLTVAELSLMMSKATKTSVEFWYNTIVRLEHVPYECQPQNTTEDLPYNPRLNGGKKEITGSYWYLQDIAKVLGVEHSEIVD